MNHVNVALAANHRYLPGLLVTAGSLVRSCSDPRRLALHILSDGLSADDIGELRKVVGEKTMLKVHDLSHLEKSLKQDLPAWRDSYTAYFRLFLVDILPAEDWVVYTDVDFIWTIDIIRLWELREPGTAIQWCLDTPHRQMIAKDMLSAIAPGIDYSRYCCSGMALLNLAKWRDKNILRQCTDLIKQHGRAISGDQDILNIVLNQDQSVLPQCWDVLWGERNITDGAAFHIIGIGRYFNGQPVTDRPQYEIWFRTYRQLCPWRTRPVRRTLLSRIYWLAGWFYWMCTLTRMMSQSEKRNTIERTWYYSWVLRKNMWRQSERQSLPG